MKMVDGILNEMDNCPPGRQSRSGRHRRRRYRRNSVDDERRRRVRECPRQLPIRLQSGSSEQRRGRQGRCLRSGTMTMTGFATMAGRCRLARQATPSGGCQREPCRIRQLSACMANALQENADSDGFGDACDNCSEGHELGSSAISDGDRIGDACDDDRDGDGVRNATDKLRRSMGSPARFRH